MPIGKEIKVVLSLDDAGFTAKTKQAGQEVKSLRDLLTGLDKGLNGVEAGMSNMAGTLKSFTTGFDQLNKTLTNSVQQMSKTLAASFETGVKGARDATAEAKRQANAQIDARRKVLDAEIETNRRLLDQRGKLHADLRRAEAQANERALAAGLRRDTRATEYNNTPLEGRKGAREAYLADIAALDKEINLHKMNATVIGLEALKTAEWITAARAAQNQRMAGIQTLEQERRAKLALAEVSAAVGKGNAAEIDRMRRLAVERDKAANEAKVASARQSNEQIKRYERERREAELTNQVMIRQYQQQTAENARRLARETAVEQRRQIQQVADMWKGMAQMYAGGKIERGLDASVKTASTTEVQTKLLEQFNFSDADNKEILTSSRDLSNQLKFISNLDAIKSRISAIQALGWNDKRVIDATLAHGVKTANNLETLGMGHGDMQTTLRNLYGVVEMRQQTADPEAIKRTFDLLNQTSVGTGGKITIADVETVLRRQGTGAATLSDRGLINMVGLADMFKVQGGEGGAGGGISTVGTIIKMMQAYAIGKTKSNNAVKLFADAGILSGDGIDFSKDKAGVLKQAKNGSFENAKLWMEDPIQAIRDMVPKIVEYTKKDKNLAKFYQGQDPENEKNQMIAVQKYLQALGITQSAIQAITSVGSKAAGERIAHQTSTIEKSAKTDQTSKELSETYARDMQEFGAELTNLKELVGVTLLPIMKDFLSVINGMVRSAREFAQNNPMATQLTAIGAAVLGVVLSFKGFVSMFGLAGRATTIFAGLTRSILGAGGAATVAGTQAAASGGMWARLSASMATGMAGSIAQVKNGMAGLAMATVGNSSNSAGARIAMGFKGIGNAAMGMARVVGGAFMRMIPYVGLLLLAWDFAQILAAFKIGGTRIDAWVMSWLDRMVVKAQNAATRIAAAFRGDKGQASALKEVEDRNAALQDRLAANGAQTDQEKKDYADRERRKSDLAQLDLINDPNGAAKLKALNDQKAAAYAKQQKEAAARAKIAKGEADPKKKDDAKTISEALNAPEEKKDRRPDRDPLNEALGEAKGRLDQAQIKLKALVAGGRTVESLKEEAIALVEGERLADNLSVNHDKKKRPGADDPQVKLLKERVFQQKLAEEQVKAITYANERMAATGVEADEALRRMAEDGAPKQTDAMRALRRELERTEERLGAGVDKFAKWALARDTAVLQQARADALNAAADLEPKNKEDKARLLTTARERLEAEVQAQNDAEDAKQKALLDALKYANEERLRTAITAASNEGKATTQEVLKAVEDANAIYAQGEEARGIVEAQFAERRRIRAEQDVRTLETATQRMTREWADVGAAVDQIGANAGDKFVSALTESLSTGRLSFDNFIKGVLEDIANAKLKQVLADPIKDMIGQGEAWVKENIFGMAKDAAATTAATSKAAADTAAAAATTAATTATGMLTAAAGAATLAIEAMAAAAATAAGSSMASAAGSIANVMFADGGVMTSMGSMQLKKYAKGGIADRPQVAIYGEGSMNEAYVPLPDGRSIPVTMQGGGQTAPSVSVNVINQTGTKATAQQGQTRFDGRQFVLDVVMSAAASPGPFRSNMKDALK